VLTKNTSHMRIFHGNFLISFAGVIIWTFLSLYKLNTVPKHWWQYRDDSVIHLSQALNFVQYGSVGVSPGGRVEAVSSPLNFLISIPFFSANNQLDFATYLDRYLLVTLLLLGLSVSYAVNQIFNSYSLDLKHKIITQVALYVWFISSWTTFGWIVSGMENVLIVILFSILIGSLVKNPPKLNLVIVALSLLGISRIEMPIFLLPIFLVILRFYDLSFNDKLRLSLIPLGFWFIFHVIRFLYFGEVFPNTATALGKSLSVLPTLILLMQFIVIIYKYFSKQKFARFGIRPDLVIWPVLFILSSLKIRETNYEPAYKLVLVLGLIVIAILFFIFTYFNDYSINLNLGIVIALIPLNHFVFFGPARLSAFRIIFTFILPVLLMLVWVMLDKKILESLKRRYLWLPVLFVVSVAFFVNKFDYERNLCCFITPSDTLILAKAEKIFDSEFPKPIVANPDLGRVSFSKQVITFDMGLLGEPMLSKLVQEPINKHVEYILNYASPDILELHGHWMCAYSDLLSHPKFPALWDIKFQGKVSPEFNVPEQLNCPQKGIYTIWQRNIPSAEIELSELISMESKSKIIEKIAREVYSCTSISAELHRCQYVTRSIIRNREYLIKKGWLNDVTELMEKSPTYLLDKLRIEEPAGWSKEAAKIFSKF
jgi:hypothetical protein